MKKPTKLSNTSGHAWSCAENQILGNKTILNICTEQWVKYFSRIYLPVREYKLFIGSGGPGKVAVQNLKVTIEHLYERRGRAQRCMVQVLMAPPGESSSDEDKPFECLVYHQDVRLREGEWEIMLFIGKPKGRSMMISNAWVNSSQISTCCHHDGSWDPATMIIYCKNV